MRTKAKSGFSTFSRERGEVEDRTRFAALTSGQFVVLLGVWSGWNEAAFSFAEEWANDTA